VFIATTLHRQQQQQQCVLIAVHADGEVRVWGMPLNSSDTGAYTPLLSSTNGLSTLVSNGRSAGIGGISSSSGTVRVGSVMASSQQQLQQQQSSLQQPLQRSAARYIIPILFCHTCYCISYMLIRTLVHLVDSSSFSHDCRGMCARCSYAVSTARCNYIVICCGACPNQPH
jgi:hypothetical protein